MWQKCILLTMGLERTPSWVHAAPPTCTVPLPPSGSASKTPPVPQHVQEPCTQRMHNMLVDAQVLTQVILVPTLIDSSLGEAGKK